MAAQEATRPKAEIEPSADMTSADRIRGNEPPLSDDRSFTDAAFGDAGNRSTEAGSETLVQLEPRPERPDPEPPDLVFPAEEPEPAAPWSEPGGLKAPSWRSWLRSANRALSFVRGRDLAIDLGTANTLLAVLGEDEIHSEPSVVAVRSDGKGGHTLCAVGAEAKRMLGRTPEGIRAVRPLRDGVIADFDMAEALLRSFIQSGRARNRLMRPRVVIAVPIGVTQVEKRAIRDAAQTAGARQVHLIHEPMAAAIGSGLPIMEPCANMVVDVGGGTTDVAVIALGGLICSESVRVGGDSMDFAIQNYVRRKLDLVVGEGTAERIKLEVGSAWSDEAGRARSMLVRGNDPVGRVPRTVEVTCEQVQDALADVVDSIVLAARTTLERTPPELSGDLADQGILLTGGGSLLPGLDQVLREHTGLPVFRAEDPLRAVVLGCKVCLQQPALLAAVELSS